MFTQPIQEQSEYQFLLRLTINPEDLLHLYQKMLVSTHIKRAFLEDMSLKMCTNDKKMRKEFTRMSANYIKEMPEPSSWMF